MTTKPTKRKWQLKFKDFRFIPLEQLEVSEHNIRKELLESEKNKLKQCIKKQKILDPLVVVLNEDTGKYGIIKGQRRFLVAKDLRQEGIIGLDELPCIIKVLTKIEAIEESLVDELLTLAVDQNDTGKAILKLVEYHGSIEKVSGELGMDVNWLRYYVHHLSLNPPAPVYKAPLPVKKPLSLDWTKQEEQDIREGKTVIREDPFEMLTIDERKEAERRLRENPKQHPTSLISAVQDWMANSFELQFRLDKKIYSALSEYSKDKKITLRRVLDKLINQLLKEHLKEESYIT